MNGMTGRTRAAALLLGSLLGLSTQAFGQAEGFCWGATTGRGVGVVPSACGPDQEKNGAFCYPKCRPGFVSDGVAGCIQSCPFMAKDDGLFCGFPSYKAAEYPIWDERVCKANHPTTGCWLTAPVIGLWVENCRQGYRHVAGFCEIINLNCAAIGLAGERIVNSCAKNLYFRETALPACGPGQESDAGLCYTACPPGAEGIGPVCHGKGPPGWVPCGMGWARDQAACVVNVPQQVASTFDAAVSAVALIGSVGAQTPAATTTTLSTPVFTKTAWEEMKKLGQAQVKESMLAAAKTSAPSGVPTTPDAVLKTTNDVVEQLWKIGQLEHDSPAKSVAEREKEVAQLALAIPPSLDPTGIGGALARHAKLTCSTLMSGGVATTGPSGSVAEIMKSRDELKRNYERQKAEAEAARASADAMVAKLAAAQAAATGDARAALLAQLNAAQTQQQTAMAEVQRVGTSQSQFEVMAPKWDALIAQQQSGAKTTVTPVLSWGDTSYKAYDIAAGANGAVWFISAATSDGSNGSIYRVTAAGPQQVAGGAMRIAVDPAGNPWVVNSGNQIYRWNGSSWQLMPGAARDVGIGANGAVWVIGTDMSPYKWNGSNWSKISGGAVLISVDPSGNPWVVNANNQIWRYDGANWALLPGAARDIGVGADGAVLVVGMGAVAGNSQVWRWVPSANNWTAETGVTGFSVAGGPSGTAYVARSRESGMAVTARIPR